MSGLGELGGFEQFTPGYGGQIQQKDIDQYNTYVVHAPSVSATYMALGTNGGGGGTALVIKSAVPDYPRNFLYQVTGGTVGGTITAVGVDQFGSAQTESVVIGTAASGGSKSGTAIWGSLTAGTYFPIAANNGTPSIGFGTKTGDPTTAGANWFGLPVRLGGTTDVRVITWINNGTATAINGGTNFGSIVGAGVGTIPIHAFQGTSGVAITDRYVVTIKTQYDNLGKGTMAKL